MLVSVTIKNHRAIEALELPLEPLTTQITLAMTRASWGSRGSTPSFLATLSSSGKEHQLSTLRWRSLRLWA